MKLYALTAAVIAVAVGLTVPSAAVAGKANTTVDFIGFADPDHSGANSRFFGDLESSGKCTGDRKLTIVGDNAGKIGTTRTDSYGHWSLEFPSSLLVEGVFTATAKATKKCKEGSDNYAAL